jgi:transposase InsO family protein
MAIVWSVDRLRQFLLGIKFTVVTDCQSLVFMQANKTKNPQIARWSCLLQEYDVDFQHRPGTKMQHVDALSRAPVGDINNIPMDDFVAERVEVLHTQARTQESMVLYSISEPDQVAMYQQHDTELQQLKIILSKDKTTLTKNDKAAIQSFTLRDGIIYKVFPATDTNKPQHLFVVPKSMRKSIAVKFHDLSGHNDIERTLKLMHNKYWFSGMRRYLKLHIKACMECLIIKKPAGKQPGLLNPIPPGTRPFHTIHIDHLGPFIRSSKQNSDLFVVICNFTKFVKLYAVRNTSSKPVISCLKNFTLSKGLPEIIISDRGTAFTSHDFQSFCTNNGIKHVLNATKNPHGNGMVERANSSILNQILLHIERDDHKDWDAHLPKVQSCLNFAPNKATRRSPFYLLYGFNPTKVDGALRPLHEKDGPTDPPQVRYDEATNNILAMQDKMKLQYDAHQHPAPKYAVGDIVVVRTYVVSTGHPNKSIPRFKGPYVITTVLDNDVYRIQWLRKSTKPNLFTTVHVARIKLWHPSVSDDIDPDSDSDSDNPDVQVTNVSPTPNLVNTPRSKPSRSKRPPAHLQDYVTSRS